ncbi:MAG: hypothetical protein AAF597_06155 [Bacteroidota bacterium]
MPYLETMPYDFVLDYLDPLQPYVKRMFGNFSVYAGDKIYLCTRLRADRPEDNGIWIGTSVEHHESLKAQFPELTNLNSYRIKKWLLLPDTTEHFEEIARALCLLMVAEDPRMGVVPPKKRK